jgi:hypothetical protein
MLRMTEKAKCSLRMTEGEGLPQNDRGRRACNDSLLSSLPNAPRNDKKAMWNGQG